MRVTRWTSLALAAVVAAVLVTPVRAQEVEIKPAAKVKRDKYVLTADEIAERPDIANALDAVKQLRPNFLKATRSKGGMAGAGAARGDRPTIDLGSQSLHGSGSGSSGGSSGGSSDPYKPSGTQAGGGSGGSSPYGGSSGGSSNSLMPVLYLDDVKQSDAKQQSEVEDRLKSVRVADIFEIRYMGSTEASGRYGSGHEGGAILVKTKRLGGG